MKARIIDIVKGTSVDGPGLRTAIYFAGCRHACEGCHNPQSWDFGAGTDIELTELLKIIEEEDFDVTLSGGDPLYQSEVVTALTNEIVNLNHNVWLYTGFEWEEIVNNPSLKEAVRLCNAVVDGRFNASLRDEKLRFRGSSNQRIIDVKASLESGETVILPY